MSRRALVFTFTVDKALGAVGCGLATASLGFGVYMNVHGPADSFGKSKDFTVFAQLAPKHRRTERPEAATPADSSEPLDMSATASIPKRPAAGGMPAPRPIQETAIIPAWTLETADSDTATISIDGREQMVRIGDLVPGAGEVLEIRSGRHAVVRTSRGLILSSRDD